MSSSHLAAPIGVIGAGTMGAGIAQVAAQTGHNVRLYDVEGQFLQRGMAAIGASLDRFASRGRLTGAERELVDARITPTSDLATLRDCLFVVEAVPERLALKLDLFSRLGAIAPVNAILATNTSSLSVTQIAGASGCPERVIGMHFFNPPVLMQLVEVVCGALTQPVTMETTVALARQLGKTPVVCRDTPGFIVNRVARPFYLASLAMLSEGLSDVASIDESLRSAGFPMGPFQLMDLVGLDVNLAVTLSVFEQRFYEARFRPQAIQQSMVRAGQLGRKSGSGFYDYSVDPPRVALSLDPREVTRCPGPWEQWRRVAGGGDPMIVGRVLSSLVNEAFFALTESVATGEAIDLAMRLGTNYPHGPFAWATQVGLPLIVESLEALERWYADTRHAPAPLLRARASAS